MIVCAATNNAGKLKELRRILTRCGLHCAPSAHKTLGTFPQGTVRFSLGWASTEADVDALCHALKSHRDSRFPML